MKGRPIARDWKLVMDHRKYKRCVVYGRLMFGCLFLHTRICVTYTIYQYICMVETWCASDLRQRIKPFMHSIWTTINYISLSNKSATEIVARFGHISVCRTILYPWWMRCGRTSFIFLFLYISIFYICPLSHLFVYVMRHSPLKDCNSLVALKKHEYVW